MRFHLGTLALLAIALSVPSVRALHTTPELSLLPHSLQIRGNPTFTPEEDQLLRELKEQNPKLPWSTIAKSFPRHSLKSVVGRYRLYIKPNFIPDPHTHSQYTLGEDQLLKRLKDEGLSWKQIADSMAKHFPRRTVPSLMNHYRENLSSEPRRTIKHFTPEEDQCLEELKRQGLEWDKIVKTFPGRSVVALQVRWSSVIKPKLNLDPEMPRFTPEDDQRLLQLMKQGLAWDEIVRSFDGRSIDVLKYRWQKHLKPKTDWRPRKSLFTPEEDQRLIRLKGQGLKWDEIAESFEERSVGALKQRWRRLVPKR